MKLRLCLLLGVALLNTVGCTGTSVAVPPAMDLLPAPLDVNRLCELVAASDKGDSRVSAELDEELREFSKPGKTQIELYHVDASDRDLVDEDDEYLKSSIPVTLMNKQRLRSLCNVWYAGNPLPEINPSLWGSACHRAFETTDIDSEYGEYIASALDVTDPDDGQNLFCYFAALDNDSDDIPDFRVNNYGRFGENDTDVDNDGISNVRDHQPFVINSIDGPHCGEGDVPHHLRVGLCPNGDNEACQLQEKLYREFDIMVVNREFDVNDDRLVTGLRVVYDTLNLVYKRGIQELPQVQSDCPGKPTLPSLKTIALAECSLGSIRNPNDRSGAQRCDNDKTTQAEAIAQNATFTILPDGASFPSMFKLGVWVHELGHSFQFAFDYDRQRYTELTTLNYWNTPGFEILMKDFGWKIDTSDKTQQARSQYANRAVFDAAEITLFDPESYRWNGRLTASIKNMIACGFNDPEGKCQTESRTGYIAEEPRFNRDQMALFTYYGANDPWEWYADGTMAYLYRLMSEQLARRSSAETVEGINVWLRASVLETWPENDFFYENISDQVFNRFQQLIPISDSQADELICRYIVNSDDTLFETRIDGIPKDESIKYGTGWARTPLYYEPVMVSEETSGRLKRRLENEWSQDSLKRQLQQDWGRTCGRFGHLKQANSPRVYR